MRITIGVEIDKNCLGCMWSDVMGDEESLYCTKRGSDTEDNDLCGEWDFQHNHDIEFLNPIFKGEIK